MEVRQERGDLREVVGRAVESIRPQIESREQQLAVEAPNELVPFDGDVARLHQVFANLLNNASKFTPRSGAIRVILESDPRDGLGVVTVEDSGIGISPDLLPRLFVPFVQGPEAEGGAASGLGIGLALARRIVELHGGTLEAQSRGVGRGSQFVVRLPLGTSAAR